jgi:mono/diheme cytochrome c family protein
LARDDAAPADANSNGASGAGGTDGTGTNGLALDGDSNANGAAGPADALAGAALYTDVNNACFVCHGAAGEGTVLGPAIVLAGAVELESTLAPGGDHSGGANAGLTADDLTDLAAFLANPSADIGTNGTGTGDDVATNGVETPGRDSPAL